MNSFRGVSQFDALGQSWTMRIDMNTFAFIEEESGRPGLEVIDELERGGGVPKITTMRLVLFAALKRDHPEIDLFRAGDILSEKPGVVMEAIMAAMPKEEDRGRRRRGKHRQAASNPG